MALRAVIFATCWLYACGSKASRLAELTANTSVMLANQQELEDSFCPVCDENPGVSIGLTTIGGIVFVACCGLLVGTDVTVEKLLQVFNRSKRAFGCGMLSQFGFMPLFAFVLSLVFADSLKNDAYHSYEASVLGLVIVGCLPGGTTSNLFTWAVGGNLPLSVLMSLFSNMMALVMLPIMIYLYYELRFQKDDAPNVPYSDIILPLLVTVVMVGVGMVINKWGTTDLVWWTQKVSSIFAIVFLFLSVAIGVIKYPYVLTPNLSLYAAALTLQPMGYLFGWTFATICRCSLKDKMTISFETGIQSFSLGMVIASLGFNAEAESCQFAGQCMRFLEQTHDKYGSVYGYAMNGGGRIREGPGEGQVSLLGFLPGMSDGRELGGCCRPDELIWLDVWKFSAICSLLYPLHAWWMTAVLRKFFRDGFAAREQVAEEPAWPQTSTRQPNVECRAEGTLPPAFAPEGSLGSEVVTPTTTLIALMESAASRVGKQVALAYEAGETEPPKENKRENSKSLAWGRWKKWTWEQYMSDVQRLAASLVSLGLEDNGTVVIYGTNAPQWNIAAVGAIFAGAKAAGIYPTDTVEQVSYKVSHSDAAVAVVEDERKLRHFRTQLDDMPKLKAILLYRARPSEETLSRSDGSSVRLLAWEDALLLGKEEHVTEVNRRKSSAQPGKPVCLVYTSGTTGFPKAVMLSHDNLAFQSAALMQNFKHRVGVEFEDDRVLSYLPLSHVVGFLLDIVVPISATARLKGWVTTYFARPYDLKEGSLSNRIAFVRPTYFVGVPRVWEKMVEALKAAGEQVKKAKGCKARAPIICCFRKTTVARWAKRHVLETMRNRNVGGSGKSTCMYGMADALFASQVRTALGFDACKIAITGAAPIAKETLEFMASYGIVVVEAYGMSECCGATTFSVDDRFLWGSCGFALPGTQVRVFKVSPEDSSQKKECPKSKDVFNPSEEEQGELCFRGRHIMMGYLANPDLGEEHMTLITKQTSEAIDAEGWLHSGDMGVVGENGMFRITGRYKELIITAGGENIAPVPIEDSVMQRCPAIGQAMMIGDRRKYNTMLITLKCEGDMLVGEAAQLVPGVTKVSEAKEHPAFLEAVEKAIQATNGDSRVCPSNASKVQKFRVLPVGFSVETDDLTPTLKLKRKAVEKKFQRTIDGMYDGVSVAEKPRISSEKAPSEAETAVTLETVPASMESHEQPAMQPRIPEDPESLTQV